MAPFELSGSVDSVPEPHTAFLLLIGVAALDGGGVGLGLPGAGIQ